MSSSAGSSSRSYTPPPQPPQSATPLTVPTDESSPITGPSSRSDTPLHDGISVDTPATSSSMRHSETSSEDQELERFRREWQAEVSRRRANNPSDPSSAAPADQSYQDIRGRTSSSDDHHEEARPHSPSRTRHLLQLADDQRKAAAQQQSVDGHQTPPFVQSRPVQRFNEDAPAPASSAARAKINAAVKAYASAVENERRGDLDAAVISYRKAFRIDSSADRLYERAQAMLKRSQTNEPSSSSSSSSPSSTSKSMQSHKDALLASPEVAQMVLRATDFDDYRVLAIEKANAEKKAAPPSLPRQRPHTLGPQSSSTDAESTTERDDLDDIILRAAENDVEGRDLPNVSFTSPPSLLSSGPAPASRDSASVDDVSRQMEQSRLTGPDAHTDDEQSQQAEQEEQPSPPPPIAKLPDDILAYICDLIVEPKGRRCAKIRPPRPEPGSQFTQHGRQQQQQQQQQLSTKGSAKPTPKAKAVADTPHHHQKDHSSQPDKPASTAVTSDPAANPTMPSRAAGALGVGIVLAGPDWQSLEMLGRVCWKWRLITRSNAAWRRILDETYYAPQLSLPLPASRTLQPRLKFIHHPRLRLTGCYIAACHYSRQGLSVDNAWVRVIHLVEFYRSIRFLPDGRVLTLLTTDQPKETVGKMHAANADKGFAVGRWRVEWPPSSDSDGSDDSGGDVSAHQNHQQGARVIIDDLKDRSLAKYSFRMVLSLRSTARGKWNKMEMLDYCSVNLETGEVLPLPQKHSRPFHFSTVRSYGV